MSRDLILYAHVLFGIIVALAFMWVYIESRRKGGSFSDTLKASWVGALSSWAVLFLGGYYYLTFYPPIKTLIKAGSWPWAHEILMETKEHWIFILVPLATIIALMLWKEGPKMLKNEETRKFIADGSLIIVIIAALIGVGGRLISMAGLA